MRLQMNTSKRAFFALLGVLVLVIASIVAITYFGLGLLTKKGDELTKLKAQQLIIKNREAALVGAKQDVKDYTELEKISKAIVPQEKDQARTVREIVAIAQEAGVPLASITFPESTLGTLKSSGSKRSSAAPKATGDQSKTQLTAVPGTKGLYAMDISVKSDANSPVPYNRLITFLDKLEQNRRTAHVTNISIQPFKDNRNLVTFTINLNVYIKP